MRQPHTVTLLLPLFLARIHQFPLNSLILGLSPPTHVFTAQITRLADVSFELRR